MCYLCDSFCFLFYKNKNRFCHVLGEKKILDIIRTNILKSKLKSENLFFSFTFICETKETNELS